MVKKDIKIEELLSEELKREMFVDSGSKFRLIDEWDTLMAVSYTHLTLPTILRV